MVHPVNARAGNAERVAGAVAVNASRAADRQALVGDAALDQVDADCRAVMVVVAGVTPLRHDVQPGDGVLVMPEHERAAGPIWGQSGQVD
jgi:hypothetical protein